MLELVGKRKKKRSSGDFNVKTPAELISRGGNRVLGNFSKGVLPKNRVLADRAAEPGFLFSYLNNTHLRPAIDADAVNISHAAGYVNPAILPIVQAFQKTLISYRRQ